MSNGHFVIILPRCNQYRAPAFPSFRFVVRMLCAGRRLGRGAGLGRRIPGVSEAVMKVGGHGTPKTVYGRD